MLQPDAGTACEVVLPPRQGQRCRSQAPSLRSAALTWLARTVNGHALPRAWRLVARDALLTMRQQARNHHHALVQWPVQVAAVKAQLDAVIADLETRITTLEAEIETVLADSAWTESAVLLRTINSVGPLTTAWLLVLTLNFQHCPTAAAAAAYAGLVPMAHESGTSVRGRSRLRHGGNKRLRTALYLATLNATRFNPVIREFYERLRAKGKPKKVARCAAARKLLQIAWAVVTTGVPFDPAHRHLQRVDR